MPPRDPSLPEGTDSIIDTNSDLGASKGGAFGSTGAGATASGGTGATGSGAGSAGTGQTGTNPPGNTGTGAASGSGDSAFQFNEGRGATSGGSSSGSAGGGSNSGVNKAADTITNQIKEQVSSLKSTAGDRARGYADDGKRQATSFLETVAQVIQDAAGTVEDKMGSQYAGFGNSAADRVNSLARTLDERDVDQLLDDARAFVRRSPALAIGAAALVGFAVARVLRSGVDDFNRGGNRPGEDLTGDASTR